MIAARSAHAELSLFDQPPSQGAEPADWKAEIDAMTFEDMLRKVRFAPLSDPLFRGEVSRYFHQQMRAKRHETPPKERAAISDRIGF